VLAWRRRPFRYYTEVPVPGGHIGTFVGGKAQKILAPTIAEWFKAR
jgi:polyhydroxyalkanoate synthase